MIGMEYENPNWAPLEAVGGLELCGEFMWMMRQCGIEFFKHIRTRRYLLLDSDGCCYRRSATGFQPVDLKTELRRARGESL